jgi:oligopeptide/dipeptide ABC transporter ATP-binding protein
VTSARSDRTDEPLLVARGLTVTLPLATGISAAPVDHVDLSVGTGEVLGIVGESGSGKTMLALSIIGLLPPGATLTADSLRLDGVDLVGIDDARLRALRGTTAAIVFQDPLSALNPVRKIGTVMRAAYRRHHRVSKDEATEAAVDALTKAGVPAPRERLDSYPHQLSGGLRQRVLIALALINGPKLLLADEPTTALDATVQAQLLRLLKSSAEERAMVFITHDLSAAAEICDRIAVMYAGRIVEEGPAAEVLDSPAHPYTVGLMGARPRFTDVDPQFKPIPGTPPRLGEARTGCAFAPRCLRRQEECREVPALTRHAGRSIACWNPDSGLAGSDQAVVDHR